jgi:small-conductance mechanosensitive channel
VKIADQEGDVKRIRVRATEIKVADGSTLIVPNSELITKTIQNMTLSDPLGRIQLQFSISLGTDAGLVRQIVTDILRDNPRVLEDPAPSVFIDQLADNRIFFNSFAYAATPRATYGIRSEILFALLERCAAAGIEIGTKQQFEFIGAPTSPPTGPGEPSS